MENQIRYIILIFILSALLSSCNNEQIEKDIFPDLAELSGKYKQDLRNNDQTFAEVEITYTSGRMLHFDISTGDIDGCIGRLEGDVAMNTDLNGTFVTETGTNLIFKFSRRELEIIETQNCQMLGYGCWFG